MSEVSSYSACKAGAIAVSAWTTDGGAAGGMSAVVGSVLGEGMVMLSSELSMSGSDRTSGVSSSLVAAI